MFQVHPGGSQAALAVLHACKSIQELEYPAKTLT